MKLHEIDTAAFLYYFAKLPLIGHLAYCRVEDHLRCLRELLVILLFATATFWFTAFLMMSVEPARNLGYWRALAATAKDGALFIFSVSFVGPILLTASEEKKGEATFPDRMWFFLAMLFLIALASNFYQRVKLSQITAVPLASSDVSFLLGVSIYMALAAVALRYLAMVYRKANFEPKAQIRDVETSFAEKYVAERESAP